MGLGFGDGVREEVSLGLGLGLGPGGRRMNGTILYGLRRIGYLIINSKILILIILITLKAIQVIKPLGDQLTPLSNTMSY